MTEASELIPPEYVGDARIKVHPGPELNEALERFMSVEYVQILGGRAIDLISENKLGVYSRPFEDDTGDWRRPAVSKSELALLSRSLNERQRDVKPRISPHVLTRAYVPPEEFKHEGNGIDLRFKILLDELTERVLTHTVLLDPADNELYVHLSIRRPNVRLGMGLNDARDDLLSLLRHKPQRVDSMYIDTDTLNP